MKRKPMWILKNGIITRIKDYPGYPPAPAIEGKVTR